MFQFEMKAGPSPLDHTPVADVAAGAVIVIGSIVSVACLDIPAGFPGALHTEGIGLAVKATGAWTKGVAIYWDDNGDPVGGTAGTGAFTTTATGNVLSGFAAAAADSADETGLLCLDSASRVATVAGAVVADSVTAAAATFPIAGLSATQGGSITLSGGPSTGSNNNGGALILRGGTKNGSGVNGVLTLGDTATSAVAIGAASIPTTIGGPVTVPAGASTGAAGSSTSDAGVLPAGTAGVYPTTAADDTKGVRVHASDKVSGRLIKIGNGVSNKILKVYAPSGGTINGASADVAFSSASGKGVEIYCLDSTGNTWLAW